MHDRGGPTSVIVVTYSEVGRKSIGAYFSRSSVRFVSVCVLGRQRGRYDMAMLTQAIRRTNGCSCEEKKITLAKKRFDFHC